MTHDELLDKITYERKFDEGLSNNALLAVVKLHKPHEITLPDGNYGMDCIVCHGNYYPCLTIQAIENELL